MPLAYDKGFEELSYPETLEECKLEQRHTRRTSICQKLFRDMCVTDNKLHDILPSVRDATQLTKPVPLQITNASNINLSSKDILITKKR